MAKFGVCNYDFDAYEPKVENLVLFENYEDAFRYYVSKLLPDAYKIDKTLWLVWTDGQTICQFEQLVTRTKCKIVEVGGQTNAEES